MDLKLAPFEIRFLYYGKLYRARVEQTFLSDIYERFKVTGGNKSLEILSDRPLVRHSKGRRKVKKQAVHVHTVHEQIALSIITKKQEHIHTLEHPPIYWREHYKK